MRNRLYGNLRRVNPKNPESLVNPQGFTMAGLLSSLILLKNKMLLVSHAPRGNANQDAPRPLPRSGKLLRADAERRNDDLTALGFTMGG